MCNNVRKNEDTSPRFFAILLPEIKFKNKKNPLRGQEERKTGSRYNDKLNTYDYILYRTKIKE